MSGPQLQNTLANRDLFATQTIELDKVVKLFTGPNSRELHSRHVAALDKICQVRPKQHNEHAGSRCISRLSALVAAAGCWTRLGLA